MNGLLPPPPTFYLGYCKECKTVYSALPNVENNNPFGPPEFWMFSGKTPGGDIKPTHLSLFVPLCSQGHELTVISKMAVMTSNGSLLYLDKSLP